LKFVEGILEFVLHTKFNSSYFVTVVIYTGVSSSEMDSFTISVILELLVTYDFLVRAKGGW
jgi:hypothetical protein